MRKIFFFSFLFISYVGVSQEDAVWSVDDVTNVFTQGWERCWPDGSKSYPRHCRNSYEQISRDPHPTLKLNIWQLRFEEKIIDKYDKKFVGKSIQYDRKYPTSRVLDRDVGWDKIKLRFQNNKLVLAEEWRWGISRKDAFGLYTALIFKIQHCEKYIKTSKPSYSIYDDLKLNTIVESYYNYDKKNLSEEITSQSTVAENSFRTITVYENKGSYGVYQSFFFTHN